MCIVARKGEIQLGSLGLIARVGTWSGKMTLCCLVAFIFGLCFSSTSVSDSCCELLIHATAVIICFWPILILWLYQVRKQFTRTSVSQRWQQFALSA